MSLPEENYAKNRAALGEVYPDFAGFLDGLDTSGYAVEALANGEKILKIRRGAETVVLGDAVSPRQRAKRLVPTAKHKKSLFVVMGATLGDLLFETLACYPQSLVVVVEHDARIFKQALRVNDYAAIIRNPRVRFFVSVKPERMLTEISRFITKSNHSNFLATLDLISDPTVVAYSKTYYETFSNSLNQAINMYWEAIVGNDVGDTLAGLRYVLANLKKMDGMATLDPYRDIFKDKIGIVVSSGPSLDASLECLRENQDRAVILSADSALRKLLKHGIKPLGVSVIERDLELPEVFRGFEIPRDVAMFQAFQALPEVLDMYPGPKYALFRDVFPFHFLPKLTPVLNLGISCAHMNLIILFLLGCREVALVGQDLAYDRKSGSSHFEGVVTYARDAEEARERIKVPDNQGGHIPSQKLWSLFSDFFSQIINMNPDRTVYNVIAKGSGALIKGAELIEPRAFFDSLKARESFSAGLDLNLGKRFISDRLGGFNDELLQKLIGVKKGLMFFHDHFPELNKAATFDEFEKIHDELSTQVSPDTLYFFDSVFASYKKRFFVAAQGLWSDEEFVLRREAYVTHASNVIRDIIKAI